MAAAPAEAKPRPRRWTIAWCARTEELEALAQRIEAQRSFAFDTETTDLDAMRARLVGLSIALGPGEAFYVPVGHRMAPDQLPLDVVLRRLGPLFEDEGIEKTAHNAKYDMVVLANEGVWSRNVAFDTMLAAYLLGEGGGGGYRPGEGALSLKWLASKRLGIEMTPISELIGKGSKQVCMADVEVEAAGRYAAADADMTGRLRPGLEEELRRQNLWPLFVEVEMPLVPVLTRMEMVGVAVDVAVLREMSIVLGREIARMEDEIHGQVGHRFNIGSPQQLGQVLFEQLKLPKTRKTKLGHSTDAQALEALRALHPIIDQIQSYRELTKLKSTYVDALPALINRAHRPRAHRLQPDGGGHRPALVQQPQPPEHPRAHGAGRPGAARLRGQGLRAGAAAAFGGLLADRAADHGPHHRGRGSGGRLHGRRGHPRRHGLAGVRRAAGRGDAGDAAAGQGVQLRGALRPERVRALHAGAAYRGRRRATSSRPTSPSTRASVATSTRRCSAPASRATPRRCWAGGATSPRSARPTPSCARRRSGRR